MNRMKQKGLIHQSTNWDQALFIADVGKRLNPAPLQGDSCSGFVGSNPTVGSTSKAPVEAATSPRAVITTAEAIATRNPIMRFSVVDLKEIHSDLPQLPYRLPEVR